MNFSKFARKIYHRERFFRIKMQIIVFFASGFYKTAQKSKIRHSGLFFRRAKNTKNPSLRASTPREAWQSTTH